MNDLETALSTPPKKVNRKKANYAIEQLTKDGEAWKPIKDGFEDTAKAMSWVKKMAENRKDDEPAYLRIVAIKAAFTVQTETKTTTTVVEV